MFRGVQTGSVDDKFRLKMPALVRGALLAKYENPAVFITSLSGGDVRVYPVSEWETVERRLSQPSENAAPLDGDIKTKILLQANHHGADGALDNQGRILIPASLREEAGMRGEVHLQWSRNHILVLGAEAYRTRMSGAKLNKDELAFAANWGV
jgi:DNA-binding transcriptional regulator/RsmH inhibitor MraZ